VEGFVNSGGGVGLDAVVCEGFFAGSEEAAGWGTGRKVVEREEGEEEGESSFEEEEVAPAGYRGVFYLENAEGEEAAEGVTDVEGLVCGEFLIRKFESLRGFLMIGESGMLKNSLIIEEILDYWRFSR